LDRGISDAIYARAGAIGFLSRGDQGTELLIEVPRLFHAFDEISMPAAAYQYATKAGTAAVLHDMLRNVSDPSADLRVAAMHRRYDNKHIPIELLRTFIAIADLGNFTKAAQDLELTQPAISAQMKRLQQLMGGEIFVKSPTGFSVSAKGSMLEMYARRILALNDQVMAFAGAAPDEQTVRLGIQSIFADRVLTDVIHDCTAAYGASRVQFACDSGPGFAKRLASGYVDLAFVVAPLELKLNVLSEWTERYVWACAPGFVLDDDGPMPLIVRAEGFLDRLAIEAMDQKEMPYRIAFSATDMTARTAAALADVGILAVPERALPAQLVVADDPRLPRLPDLRVGVFYRDGFDVGRIRKLAEAFVAAVKPRQSKGAEFKPPVLIQRSRSR
jgi:DNA-binding transcriptional LysR family regulator